MRRLSQALAILLVGGALSGLSFEGRRARLRRELSEGLLEQRVLAASELRVLRPSEAEPLIEVALGDPELRVQELAIEAAIQLGLRRTLVHTRALFESEDPQLRRLASLAEGELGDAESVAVLTRALSDARALVREAAAHALGQLRLATCAPPLRSALDDPDTSVRVSAAEALASTPGSRATDILLARSLDRTTEVRAAVIRALAERTRTEPERILPVLAASLDDEAESVRLAAMLGVGRARDARAVATLTARITPFFDVGAPARSRQPEEALTALAALGRIDASSARRTLVRALVVPILRDVALDGLERQSMQHEADVGLAFAEALLAFPAHTDTLARILVEAPRPSPELVTTLLGLSLRAEGDPNVLLPALAGATTRECEHHDEVVVHLLARLEDPPSRRGATQAIRDLAQRGLVDEAAREAFLNVTGATAASETERTGHDELDALHALASLSPLPVEALLAEERDSNRAALLEALHSVNDIQVRELALRAMSDPHPEARQAALRFFREHVAAPAPVEALLALEAAPRSVDRFGVLEALAMLAPASSAAEQARIVPLLEEAIRGEDPRLVGAVATGLYAGGTEAHLALFQRVAPRSLARIALFRAHEGLRDEASFLPWVAAPQEPQPRSPHHFAFDDDLSFPTSITRSFAALALARAGALEPEDTRLLCALAERREPSVRANAALALAAVRTRCEGLDPLRFVTAGSASQLQLAGLAWFSATTTLDAESREAIEHCAESALDTRVAEACGALARAGDAVEHAALEREAPSLPPEPLASTWLDVVALDARDMPLAAHWVTLEFSDGSSLAARTDESGRIAMRVPAATLVRLSDPFASVLEP